MCVSTGFYIEYRPLKEYPMTFANTQAHNGEGCAKESWKILTQPLL